MAALAVANNGGLPMDVLFEVLLRFPADVLCRLRLVCRSWRQLTSDTTFAEAHLSRHRRPLLSCIHIDGNGCHEVRVVDLSGNVVKRIPIKHSIFSLCSTPTDLVCVSEEILLPRRRSSLVNLATGQVATFIPPVRDKRDTSVVGVSPLLLGHVPSTGEHKVFYSCSWLTHGRIQLVQACRVATLACSGGMWRATPRPPVLVAEGSRERVVIGGVAFFLLSKWYYNQRIMNPYGNLEPDAIAVLDLATEEWRPATLQGPLSSRLAGDDDDKLVYREHRNDFRLAALNGCLVTVHRHNSFQDDASMDLWFLEDMDMDKGLWTKRYSIRCASYHRREYASSDSYSLLVLGDGRIAMWEEGSAHALRAYDPRTSNRVDLATLTNCISVSMYQGNLL